MYNYSDCDHLVYHGLVDNVFFNGNEEGKAAARATLGAAPTMVAPTGEDDTEMIQDALDTVGYIFLGPGEYLIDGIEMPIGSSIVGSGPATKLYVAEGTSKFGIKGASNCSVSNFAIYGGSSTRPTTEGGRIGILLGEESGLKDFKINNIHFSGFNFAGLYLNNVGYGSLRTALVTGCTFDLCYAGARMGFHGEYATFTSCMFNDNYRGVMDNGGNNMYGSCGFNGNTDGMYMDGTDNGNNGHGQCVGASFNHSASDGGVGIRLKNITNGFVFSGCYIWSGMNLDGCTMINVTGCTFPNEGVTMTNGGSMMMVGCQVSPTARSKISTPDDNLSMSGCYSYQNPITDKSNYNVGQIGTYIFAGNSKTITLDSYSSCMLVVTSDSETSNGLYLFMDGSVVTELKKATDAVITRNDGRHYAINNNGTHTMFLQFIKLSGGVTIADPT